MVWWISLAIASLVTMMVRSIIIVSISTILTLMWLFPNKSTFREWKWEWNKYRSRWPWIILTASKKTSFITTTGACTSTLIETQCIDGQLRPVLTHLPIQDAIPPGKAPMKFHFGDPVKVPTKDIKTNHIHLWITNGHYKPVALRDGSVTLYNKMRFLSFPRIFWSTCISLPSTTVTTAS